MRFVGWIGLLLHVLCVYRHVVITVNVEMEVKRELLEASSHGTIIPVFSTGIIRHLSLSFVVLKEFFETHKVVLLRFSFYFQKKDHVHSPFQSRK
jgi:hypothetical protein